jgi:hypothetical protein
MLNVFRKPEFRHHKHSEQIRQATWGEIEFVLFPYQRSAYSPWPKFSLEENILFKVSK